MSLGVQHKYALKDCLIMAPESVLNKKSILDIYALGIFLVHLLFGIDVQRVKAEKLSTVRETFDLSH